jgi:hypothetical protein
MAKVVGDGGLIFIATVIASGTSIGGQVNTVVGATVVRNDVEAAPSKYQGFGRIQLDKALPFDDSMEW